MSANIGITIAGDFGPAATKLVEVCAQAVGGIFKPYQVKRIAKAEAQAAIIKDQGEILLTDLHQRAIARFIGEEATKQENMEQIINKALPALAAQSHPEKMEHDWVANFFDKCRIISDDQMQTLWAKVLAGEANVPGTYDKRTVNLLASFGKDDAVLFTSFCGFVWDIAGSTPLIHGPDDQVYSGQGLNFERLTHLDTIGVITFSPIQTYLRANLPEKVVARYQNKGILLQFRGMPGPEGNDLEIGNAILTAVGAQLAKVCDAKPVPGFFDYIVQRWADAGLQPTATAQPAAADHGG